MKKALFVAMFFALVLGVSQAYAVPTVDGTLGVGEWANVNASAGPYPFYREGFDPNEALIPDAYDLSHGVLLQELDGFGGDGIPGNDGVYLLLEVYTPPPSLVDQGAGLPFASIVLNGDFNGDGIYDFFIEHRSLDGSGSFASQKVFITNPGAAIFGADLEAGGGSFSRAGTSSVLEYFIPTGSFGTPAGVPFPASFQGKGVYDNGGTAPDDELFTTASVVPEPSTMMLIGTSLLGLAGGRKFFGKN